VTGTRRGGALLVAAVLAAVAPWALGARAQDAGPSALDGRTAPGDRATGDRATGDAATGDRATGDAATGDAATGDAATGAAAAQGAGPDGAATGSGTTGGAAAGSATTGGAAAGGAAAGSATTGGAATDGTATDGRAGAGAAPSEPADPLRRGVRLVATGRLAGALAQPRCTDAGGLVPNEATMTRRAAAAAREGGALVLDTGGLLGPGGIARFLSERDPAGLAGALAGAGFGAVAIGVTDLSAPRGPVLATWTALEARGVPVVASNLRCGAAARAVCEGVHDAGDGVLLLDVGGVRVAFLALLDTGALRSLARDASAGLRIEAPAAALARLVPAARRAGARVVVASLDDGGGSAQAALALGAGLPARSRPDLLLSAGGGGELLFARPPRVSPAFAAPPPRGAVDVLVRAVDGDDTLDFRARPLGTSRPAATAGAAAPGAVPGGAGRSGAGPATTADAGPLAPLLAARGADYCARWGRTLPGGLLSRGIDAAELATLAARVVRAQARADVAIVNLGAFAAELRTLRPGALTASDVFVGVPFDDPLVVATVDSRWLDATSRRLGAERLVTAGLERTDAGARTGGRPLVDGARYRVVTLAYLVEPPSGVLDAGPAWERVPGASLRTALLAYLEAERAIDPRDAVPDPALDAEWSSRLVVDLTFGGTAIANPTGDDGARRYTTTQLTRDPTIGLGVSVESTTSFDATYLRWVTDAGLRYRVVWAASRRDQGYQESDDLLRLQTSLTWKVDGTAEPVWYLPRPVASLYLESELTLPEGPAATRDYRHLLVRPTLGLSFLLARPLVLTLIVGVEDQALSPAARFDPGVGAQLALSPWVIGDATSTGITLEANVNYFLRDALAFAARAHTLRARASATFALSRWLGLSLGYDLYLEKLDGAPMGLGLQATASVRGTAVARTSAY
jgi:hypothetical protein